ncbi:MAG TPA: hypothetical protein VIF14_11560 [Alphaproteobacteria bacterium]|jgi:hypothetical protein
MSPFVSFGWRLRAAACAGALALGAFAGGAFAQDASTRELMRKVQAGETEDGFCATTGWPAGSGETNIAFREGAVVGSLSRDTFNGAAICALARVTNVYYQQGRKCIRYQWWACQVGKTCGSGTTLSCKGADGRWLDTKL